VNNKIYLIGGIEPFENGKGAASAAGTRCSTRGQHVGRATLSPMPTTRNHAFVGVVNNKIYVIGDARPPA
jgi:hypothetical protein